MPKKLTTEEFIQKAKKVHGDKYDYSEIEYINSRSNVKIICKVHGEFEQKAGTHLKGSGCKECYDDSMRSSTSEFINRAKEVHGDIYDYSKVNYISNKKKVKIICKKHGMFEQQPYHHLQGDICLECAREDRKDTTDDFINKANIKHNYKYDYSEVVYVDSKTKVTIICREHGKFTQSPSQHLDGSGCSKCSGNKRLTKKEFVERAKEVHGDIYDYTLVKYHNSLSKVDIICQDHGIFKQSPSNHLKGRGCSKCKMSSGEKLIYDYLTENKIEFQSQKTFNDCKYKSKLRFDFFIPNKNIVIEYDGEFHFIPIKHWGNEENLKYRQKLDKIKTKFCKDNNIELLRIPYWEQNNIRTILGDMLK